MTAAQWSAYIDVARDLQSNAVGDIEDAYRVLQGLETDKWRLVVLDQSLVVLNQLVWAVPPERDNRRGAAEWGLAGCLPTPLCYAVPRPPEHPNPLAVALCGKFTEPVAQIQEYSRSYGFRDLDSLCSPTLCALPSPSARSALSY